MIRTSIALATMLALMSTSTIAQEADALVECDPTTLFEALGIEPVDGCDHEGEVNDADGAENETAASNAVSEAAKLPGSNREAALAHANERSGGAVEQAHSRQGESGSENRGGGKGNGKK